MVVKTPVSMAEMNACAVSKLLRLFVHCVVERRLLSSAAMSRDTSCVNVHRGPKGLENTSTVAKRGKMLAKFL